MRIRLRTRRTNQNLARPGKRSRCKDGGGKRSLCEHGRQRYNCKDCGGGGICEHGRRRTQCKECGGSSICEHGRRRSTCKECRGGATSSKRARKAPVLVVQAELAMDDEEEAGPSASHHASHSASAAWRGRLTPEPALPGSAAAAAAAAIAGDWAVALGYH